MNIRLDTQQVAGRLAVLTSRDTVNTVSARVVGNSRVRPAARRVTSTRRTTARANTLCHCRADLVKIAAQHGIQLVQTTCNVIRLDRSL